MKIGIIDVQKFISDRVDVAEIEDLRILCEETIKRLRNYVIKKDDYIEVYFGNTHMLSRFNGSVVKVDKVDGELLTVKFPDCPPVDIALKRVKRRVAADEAEQTES